MVPSPLEVTMKITVRFDDFRHDPPNMGERATVRSFNRRHCNSADPDAFGLVVKEGRITSSNPGIRQRLDTGTAFILSAYEHGNIVWSLGGEGYRCRWDTAPVAGILFIDRKRGQSREVREAEARDFLKAYTAWSNGETYDVSLWADDEYEQMLDSHCCLGYKEVQEAIRNLKDAYNLPDDILVEDPV
jgi:hypothetical protein